MDQRARDLIKMGDGLFGKRTGLDALWQEIAEQFYPERADFTARRPDSAAFAEHLFTSYPVLARRELGNLFAAMLRPRTSKWFGIHVRDEALDNASEERHFLEHMTDVQWRAMYDPAAQFVRATREADHDFSAFGRAVIRSVADVANQTLLHSCYHLRDCAWSENESGRIDVMHRRMKRTARQLKAMFPDRVSPAVNEAAEKEPEKEFTCRHIVVPQQLYDYRSRGGRRPDFVSLYIECESETVLEEVGQAWFDYVVPRWQTVSGSQYARSPATEIVLPDARTMQAVVRVLREAGEKFVDPPMAAIMEAIRSDIALYAGGITTADIEYDERLGEVLRPVTQDKSGMPIGFEIAQALQNDIRSGFFLDKIQLPEIRPGSVTATEIRRRVEEHIRQSAPLFEPIEQEYNAPLCELDFRILLANHAFGPPDTIPERLRGAEVEFTFSSPLRDVADQAKAAMFAEGLQTVVLPAAQVDPAQLANVNLTRAVRDALRGGGWPADWLADEGAVEAWRQAEAEKQDMAEGAGLIRQLSDAGLMR